MRVVILLYLVFLQCCTAGEIRIAIGYNEGKSTEDIIDKRKFLCALLL